MTTALAGPVATLILAGLGATVIKVENPKGDAFRNVGPYLGRNGIGLDRRYDDDISIAALNRLRNKLSVTLDIKNPAAREVMADLLRHADMVVENFSRGTLDRLGFGYDFAREVNPRIVFCSLTGFGSVGEGGDAKAMDTIVQALSGLMYVSGERDDPPVRFGLPLADLATPLFGLIGALAALHQARTTGVGRCVDISMLGALSMMVAAEPFDVLERCGIDVRTGPTAPRMAPFGIYPTRDGYVAICASYERFARPLLRVVQPGLEDDPRFAVRDRRLQHAAELNSRVKEFTHSRTTAEVIAKLEAAEIPVAEVRGPREAIRDPRVLGRGETVPLPHPTYGAVGDVVGMGLPIRFTGERPRPDRPPPAVGEHNHAVYHGILGYSPERIGRLKMEKVI